MPIIYNSALQGRMRVVSGKAKGRRLRGAISPGGRPTTERVRAAIFNIIDPGLFQGGRVLDLYACSGSLGIEALSRGAGWADFVERDRRQCLVIQSNLENTGFAASAAVHCADVSRSLSRLMGPYQLVLLDPPYRMGDLEALLEKVASAPGLIASGGMAVVGHSRQVALSAGYGPLRLTTHRRYGDNVVDFYLRDAD